ncbi:MAG: radical SAM protein [Deltaproteobacteria bacterium]|nr:radical SAM protein [Deltaproteobacteria bacterium]
MNTVNVYSIFYSLQGESTYMGLPCVFVRLTGCTIGCKYCDTKGVAKATGEEMTINEVLAKVATFDCQLVEVTGGEPLQQENAKSLLKALCDAGYEVLLETSGQEPVADVDKRVHVVMDIKTPGSGVAALLSDENIAHLKDANAQIKFVITDRKDFDFAVMMEKKYSLTRLFPVHISPIAELDKRQVAGWILSSKIPFRMQLQLHKIIWPNALGEV